MANKITGKTLIPLSMVISLIGAVVWVTMVYAKVNNIEKRQVISERGQINIDRRLSQIEGMLKIIIKNQGR